MDMDAPDQHLAAPPLGALDQLGVTRCVGELLGGPLRERMGARTEQLHATGMHDPAGRAQGGAQVLDRLAGRAAHTADHLDGVAQQLLVHPGVFADLGDDRGGFIAQIPGLGVDQGELPLHSYGRPRRTREIYPVCGPTRRRASRSR